MAITTAMRTQVTQLYVSLFGRAPESSGLGYWVGQLDAGKSVQAVAQDMYNVDAARAYYPTYLTNSEIVEKFYTNVLGRTGDTEGVAYWTAKLNSGSTKGALIVDMINAVSTYSGTDTAALASKALFANKVAAGLNYAVTLGGNDVAAATQALVGVTALTAFPGQTVTLSTTVETLGGTAGNDTFVSRIRDNSNTLQSDDKLSGGAGNDRLEADIGNSQKFAITPETTSIETVAIRVEAVGVQGVTDGAENNPGSADQVHIDAQRMSGVTQWEDNNSRADLLIEDVRILDSQITRDITIAMVETDPGHVDFGVYFDQYSLRANTNNSSVLRLQLMDTRSNALGDGPLKESPYNGFAFYFGGKLVQVQTNAIDDAQTYSELLAAIKFAVANTAGLEGVSVNLGSQFVVFDTLGSAQTGTEITLTSNGPTISATGVGAGWIANGAVPPSSGLHTNMSSAATASTDLVTSKIILDDVGRGSTGGDLVVGGLSVGDTSSSQGVQKFEIEVRDNSKLETINSTNNTLREVTFVNGVTTSSNSAYTTTVKDKGNLTVNGISGKNGVFGFGNDVDAATGINAPLPGSAAQHNTYGFSDVRILDATTFAGKLEYTAEITTASIAKYINLKDNATNPAVDNINFVYTGGTNADVMSVSIDGGVLGSNGLLLAGREDFTFTANGGAGNDRITLKIVDQSGSNNGDLQAWYNNQKLNANVTINGGDGDDTITKAGAGDTTINGDTGNDTIYADNTGSQGAIAVPPSNKGNVAAPRAVYVFNTTNQSNLTTAVVPGTYAIAVNEDRNLADLRSDANNSYRLFSGKLTVSFMDLTSTVNIASNAFLTSDLRVNQAIKDAINNDAVLNKLLVATDGPANTLIVTSLIDGVMNNADLSVSIASPTTLSAADIAGAGAAYGIVAPTEALVLAAIAADVTAFNTKGDYVDQLAETGNTGTAANNEITGRDSSATSDNIITGGAGNDVIVLGTAGQNTIDAAYTTALQISFSNDVVVFAPAFGNDVIVNFKADTDVDAVEFSAGYDQLNFRALGGNGAAFAGPAISAVDKSITVVAETIANDTAAEIAALYLAAGDSATAVTHTYVAYNPANVGSVYTVVDGVGVAAGNIVVTLAGTIDLADTGWGTLTSSNFV